MHAAESIHVRLLPPCHRSADAAFNAGLLLERGDPVTVFAAATGIKSPRHASTRFQSSSILSSPRRSTGCHDGENVHIFPDAQRSFNVDRRYRAVPGDQDVRLTNGGQGALRGDKRAACRMFERAEELGHSGAANEVVRLRMQLQGQHLSVGRAPAQSTDVCDSREYDTDAGDSGRGDRTQSTEECNTGTRKTASALE